MDEVDVLDAASRAEHDVQFQLAVSIPMRDGVLLGATLYCPRAAPPSLCVFAFTPYVGQGCHDYGMYFAKRGFTFVVVDIRGRGNSQGEMNPHTDGRDGYDVVEWLAGQSFCNGKVVMWGGSYMGYLQWATAKQLPSHLIAIVPVAAPFKGVDAPLCKNFLSPYSMAWLMLVSGRTMQDRIFGDAIFLKSKYKEWFELGAPFRDLDKFFGYPSARFQEWMAHPQQDEYWDGFNPTAEDYSKIAIPILTITGMYDGDQLGALAHYRAHVATENRSPSRHFLVIGPWDHFGTSSPRTEFAGLRAGPASVIDLKKLHADWYWWVMHGGPRPRFLEKAVTYYLMGAEEWRYADTLESVTKQYVPLYLHSVQNPTDVFSAGELRREESVNNTPDFYIYDPRDVRTAGLEMEANVMDMTDQTMVCGLLGRNLIYHSAPFETDVEITGFFRLCVWLSIDQADTSFCASIYEVLMNGMSVRLTSDFMRARNRQGLRTEQLVSSTEPLCYEFDRFTFVSRRASKGSRLRLVFGPLDSIYWQRTYNSGTNISQESIADARAVTVCLYHGPRHPSAIYVPVGA